MDKEGNLAVLQDKGMKNIQNTLMSAMDPISKVWIALHSFMKSGGEEVDTPSMLKELEKGIICFGQTNVYISYYHRLPIVIKLLGNASKAQTLLKKHS